MPNPVPARYHDAKGVEHEVVARKARNGAWQVLDVTARKSTLVESLTGVDEGEPEAEAIAREYARDQRDKGSVSA
jgi:hypothetical protein